jgi:hypothetical protein
MPYKLRKKPRQNLYWVVNSETGKKHSYDALDKPTAIKQMRALYANEGNEMPEIKVVKKNPNRMRYPKDSDLARERMAHARSKKKIFQDRQPEELQS